MWSKPLPLGGNRFRMVYSDNHLDVMLYTAYWDNKRQAYRLYPHKVLTPGREYPIPPLWVSDIQIAESRQGKA